MLFLLISSCFHQALAVGCPSNVASVTVTPYISLPDGRAIHLVRRPLSTQPNQAITSLFPGKLASLPHFIYVLPAIQASCKEHYESGATTSGVYLINPSGTEVFDVYCDMDTAGGGWSTFQRRFDGSVDFFRNMSDYANGFGDVNGEHWLGLDKLYQLANSSIRLRIDLLDYDDTSSYAEYNFSIGTSSQRYRLSYSFLSGTANEGFGNGLGRPFSTYDEDNDRVRHSCANVSQGGWWYNNCYWSNLNGVYGLPSDEMRALRWRASIAMKQTWMKVRAP